MVLTVIAMDHTEKFLRFVDPDLINITETHNSEGFRSVNVEYTFQDLKEDKLLFQMGNKLWIQGDANLEDCLYVIDTQVKEDVYKENTISFEAEEVLVELNYAPLFSQTELSNSDFKTITTNDKMEVVVNWNALNYWFGNYFNIGVVQKCISDYASRLTITGTISLMNLLRYIEEETGNVFVTRYEKDTLTNTIHRYLDFLNPINASKDWMVNVEYTFLPPETSMTIYDADDNITTDTYDDVEEEDDIVVFNDVTTYTNLDPDNVVFRITNGEDVLNTDGLPYDEDNESDTPFIWDSETIGFENNYTPVVVTLIKEDGNIGLDCNDKSYSIPVEEDTVEPIGNGYLSCINDDSLSPVNIVGAIPDGSYFEMYDTETDKVIYQTLINNRIGTVHEEILDFGFNMENVTFETDESETINAISPVLDYENNDYTRTQINNIINDWKGLSITKGQIYPLTVQKITVNSDSLENAKRSLGSYVNNSGANVSTDVHSNYWRRPKRPNDNSGQSYEFLRGVTYWTAQFDKIDKDLHIETDNITGAKYTHILNRTDDRNSRGISSSPKMGTLEITEEDPYHIYGLLAQELRTKQYPTVDIEVDVANLIGHEYNNYDLHDKVYIKLPDSEELITARIVETHKEAHDIAKNTVKLSNYSINTYKTIQETTYIEADNQQFSYPSSKTLTARLINADNTNGVQYPSSKLLVFNIYSDSNNELIKTYTKLTDGNGNAKVTLKLNPGDYHIDIGFYGDEEYMESVLSIDCNVDGTNEIDDSKTKAPQKAKTTRRTTTTSSSKTVKTYWSKCGKSPDKKKIRAIAKPSGPDANNYKYQFYDTIFKNKCPICHHEGTLVFDGGKANKCVKSAGARGRGYKIGVPEHEITCNHCDSDFCAVTGIEKWNPPRGRLKTLEKPKKADKHAFGKLTKGQMLYGTKTVSTKKKTMTSSKGRNAISSHISNTLKQKAKSICKGSTGLAAAKKIAAWCGSRISYCRPMYTGFKLSPEQVLAKGYGNCCDQTRLMLSLMDAAGCRETLTLKYVHVCCGSRNVGHVFAQIIDSKGKKRYVDPCKTRNPWGNYVTGWGSPPGNQKTYPTRPF